MAFPARLWGDGLLHWIPSIFPSPCCTNFFFQMKDLWNKWWPFGERIHQTDCWVSLAGSTVPRRGAVTAGKQTNVLIYYVAWYPKFQRLKHLISTFLFLRVWDNYWAHCMRAWTPHHSPKHWACKQIPQKSVCRNGKEAFFMPVKGCGEAGKLATQTCYLR